MLSAEVNLWPAWHVSARHVDLIHTCFLAPRNRRSIPPDFVSRRHRSPGLNPSSQPETCLRPAWHVSARHVNLFCICFQDHRTRRPHSSGPCVAATQIPTLVRILPLRRNPLSALLRVATTRRSDPYLLSDSLVLTGHPSELCVGTTRIVPPLNAMIPGTVLLSMPVQQYPALT